MSFLTPLYVIGLAAISLPILLHLLRRTPRGRQVFSSLMFLKPSPPRLTRRNHLDNLLLLLLRGLALTLIALAFARPFRREAAELDLSGIRGKRVAIVMDVSASMKRPGLWKAAKDEANAFLQSLGPRDQAALITFDNSARVETPFLDDAQALLRPGNSLAAVKTRMEDVQPRWGGSDIGAALAFAADALTTSEDRQQTQSDQQIVLISDCQSGARLAALQQYEWPKNVAVDVRTVIADAPTNARATLVASSEEKPELQRVRVYNAKDSEHETFELRWRNAAGENLGEPLEVYVPPGQFRVFKIERPSDEAVDRLVLEGDEAAFDNVQFVAPWRRQKVTVAYCGGDDPGDPKGLRYYLERALDSTPRREIAFVGVDPAKPLLLTEDVELAVIAASLQSDQVAELKAFVTGGGAALVVLRDVAMGDALASLLDQEGLKIKEVEETDYAMLGEIDFRHPLFAAFADSRLNDFTKIRFWKRRSLELADDDSIRVAARFDRGDPALVERTMGDGSLVVLASGWNPDDSQLALSSKFVPLMSGLLDRRAPAGWEERGVAVNQPADLPDHDRAERAVVSTPDGGEQFVSREAWRFSDTHQPGVYGIKIGSQELSLAVNIDAEESRTAPFDPGRLEQYGVLLGEGRTYQEEVDRRRQLRDLELEARQKLWRLCVLGAMGLLILETWLGGRLAREIVQDSGDSA